MLLSVWAGTPWYLVLEFVVEVCKGNAPLLAASQRPMAHCYFGKYFSELAIFVPLPHFRYRYSLYSNNLYHFTVKILDITMNISAVSLSMHMKFFEN